MQTIILHILEENSSVKNCFREKLAISYYFTVFVQGDFNNPEDVVCTTWTWVYIGATCMIFLVFSILVVCVLCIYTNRRSSDQGNKSRHYLNSAHHSIVNGVSDRGMSTSTPGVYYETQATYRTPHTPGQNSIIDSFTKKKILC